ncbi:hypothetical protein LAC81_09185 [Ensifer adhaerens]|uniref:hypothetical protein n=1 Tax=Ensifer adhaerens TaxID=106592 RepID=UPI001CC0DF48|nr:hypothetical protein [Ensifer adhaerens]MBZ7921955.1 hypothetical protein [Ensifer adhaerens]UAX94350.1 hypothetical protein LAC78_09180 [Ensifer adhaerens]UAY01985.1 hypothetical protein LAC80_09190 [Ensifer adhaerens]UAY09368.1 hypothetical protein LAC81_09185 [Ensifer adhaerens]
MDYNFRRTWDGTAWQRHAHILVQMRHGPPNVQRVPDKVQGDAGLEFFTLDGCLYQCFAPEDPGNTSKTSSAMKQKATRDLPKLKKYEETLTKILCGLTFNRWILLCPVLDDKSVVSHVRAKGAEIAELGLPFLSDDFVALVQSQDDFAAEVARLRELPIGPELVVLSPTEEEIVTRESTDLVHTLDGKLTRAFPRATDVKRAGIRRTYVKNHIKRDNTLASLKTEHPALWERAWQTISAEESRLEMLGSAGEAAPAERLKESLSRIEEGLKKDLPHVAHATITDLSAGTLSDWLMRCPLDFDGDC